MITKYGFSFDEEHYHGPCESVQQAIEEAKDYDRDATVVYIGEAVTPRPEDFVRADELIEHIQCQDEFCGEWAEGWPDETPDQMAELTTEIQKAVATWLDKHDLRPKFFNVINPKRVEI